MPVKPERLQKRGDVYWLRVRVPLELVPILGKVEFHESLKTTDLREAKKRVRVKSVVVDQQIDAARRQLAASKPALPPDPSDGELWGLAASWFVSAEKRAAQMSPLRFEVSEAKETIARALGDGVGDDEASQLVWSILEEAGLAEALPNRPVGSLPKNGPRLQHRISPWHLTLYRYVTDALVEHERRNINRLAGGNLELNPRFTELSASSPASPVRSLSLAELLRLYFRDPTKPAASPKTILKREAQTALLCELLGSKTPISTIGRDTIRETLSTLQTLPANSKKKFPALRLADIATMPAAQKGRLMSATTVNSYMHALSSAMSFAVAEGYIEKNPAFRIAAPSGDLSRSELRLPFSSRELTAIFTSPIYTGCVDDELNYARKGTEHPRRAKFWVPLLALYTGMRLNEILQLTADDVVERDGVSIILVRASEDGTKRLKSKAGARFIPVHPMLKRIGFLHQVTATMVHDGDAARLFSDVAPASTSYYSDNFSKWFARFRVKVGITARGKTFHSFRHNFRDALREADMSIEKAQALGGWSSWRTDAHYGSGLGARTLAADLAVVQYPDLDLSHLWAPS